MAERLQQICLLQQQHWSGSCASKTASCHLSSVNVRHFMAGWLSLEPLLRSLTWLESHCSFLYQEPAVVSAISHYCQIDSPHHLSGPFRKGILERADPERCSRACVSYCSQFRIQSSFRAWCECSFRLHQIKEPGVCVKEEWLILEAVVQNQRASVRDARARGSQGSIWVKFIFSSLYWHFAQVFYQNLPDFDHVMIRPKCRRPGKQECKIKSFY